MTILTACGSGSGSGAGGSGSSSGGGGNVVSSPKDMGTGDVVYVDLSSGSGSAAFPSSGTFKVLLQSHATDGLTNTYTLSSVSAAGKSLGLGEMQSDLTLAESEASDQDLLDSTLRDNDLYWSSQDLGAGMAKFLSSGKSVSKGAGGDINAAISKEDTVTLYVLDSLTDTTDCVQVTATAKYVGSNVAVFVDNEILDNNSKDLSQSDIDAMGAIYDDQFTDVTGWLGGVSDINSDGATIALITSQINKLTSSGGGIVTGYFNSDDLSDYNASTNPCSNAREIVYLVSPDSDGIYSTKVSNGFWKSNFGPSVFPHELQHLINHYQRVVVNGAAAESACLNEGLSHLIEDLVGYNVENYSRYDLFLASPQSYSVCGGTSLALRGGIYLFLRYLYERGGNSTTFLKNMVQSSDKNYTNIVNAFPSKTSDFDSIGEFLRQWATALAYTNSGVSTAAKFKYNDRVKNATTGNWEGVCMDCSAQDNRGTILDGPSYGTYSGGSFSLKDAATRFLKISSNPSSITFSANTASKGYAIILRTQ
ncbi:MAG: hypothetical protein HY466_00250 [Deltaproteobacteria bacterium]|nr:hypothetical protein [Deltaproteobacteria bacterium]